MTQKGKTGKKNQGKMKKVIHCIRKKVKDLFNTYLSLVSMVLYAKLQMAYFLPPFSRANVYGGYLRKNNWRDHRNIVNNFELMYERRTTKVYRGLIRSMKIYESRSFIKRGSHIVVVQINHEYAN